MTQVVSELLPLSVTELVQQQRLTANALGISCEFFIYHAP